MGIQKLKIAGPKYLRRIFTSDVLERRTLLSAWPVVDDFQLAPAQLAINQVMATDSAGNVYAAGVARDSQSNSHEVLREKLAGSATWNTILNYTAPGQTTGSFYGIAFSRSGDLYVSGEFDGAATPWLVLERPAGSSAFTVVDAPASGAWCNQLAIDPAGNVFAVGDISKQVTVNGVATTQQTWTVRKQTGGKGAFTTVDSVPSDTFVDPKSVASIASGPAAGVYVAGIGPNKNWLVRKSTDGGATWTTADNFAYGAASTLSTQASGVSGDGAGNVYVVGRSLLNADVGHWLVRKSADGGATWSTVDDFQSSGTNTGAFTVGTDLSANVYVVGAAQDSAGLNHAIIRTNAAGTWQTISDLPDAISYSFTADAGGALYVGTRTPDGATTYLQSHWTVQSITSTLFRTFGATLTGFSGVALGGVVGSFSDSNSSAKPSDFTASINWGDGHTSPGAVAFNASTGRFEVTATNTYATAGIYPVSISITAGANLKTTITSSAAVTVRGPQPYLTGPTLTYEGSSFSIQVSATDTDNLPITKWLIDWGDGSSQQLSGSATAASHTYPDGYALNRITATATDSSGYSNSSAFNVQVEDVPPTADLSATAPASLGQPGSVQFTNVSDPSAPDTATGFLYSYDFNNDGVFDLVNTLASSASVPAHLLFTPGPHTIRARVADKDGLFTDHTATITVPSAGTTPTPDHDLLATAAPIPAALYCSASGARDPGDGSQWLAPGDFLAFCMDFGSGVAKAKLNLRAATTAPTLKFQMRLDGANGPLLASFSSKALSRSGQSVRARNVTGRHALYLVVTSGQADITNFSFTPIQAKHARHVKAR